MTLDRDASSGATTTYGGGMGDSGESAVHFGRLIAVRRSALGLSQEELAERMHTSRSAIARMERDRRSPNATLLGSLADVLAPFGPPGDWDSGAGTGIGGVRARAGKSHFAERLAGVALAATIALAPWLAVIVADEGGAMVGLAIAAGTVAALWLSGIAIARGARNRVPAAIVVALWISVIGAGLITAVGGPVSNIADDRIKSALAAPRAEVQAGGALGVVASGGGQSPVAAGAPAVAAVAGFPGGGQAGGCASLARAGGSPAVLAIGILPSPWTGGLVIHYTGQGCGPESRLTLSHDGYAGGKGPGSWLWSPEGGFAYGDQGASPGGDQGGSPSGGQGGAPSGDDTVAETVNKPVSEAGDTVGNAVDKPVSEAVETVTKPVTGGGNTVSKPVSGAGNTGTKPAGGAVNNVGNAVGNTVNNVGNVIKNPVSGVGGLLKGLGGN